MRILPACLFALSLGLPLPTSAQTPPTPAPTPSPRPRATAIRASAPMVIDGHLDEADWRRAQAASGFVQRDPDEGKPATEDTEIRFVYDDTAIYVGARMFDREPGRIARRLTRRDDDADSIADRLIVAFDPLHDKLTGNWFQVTAAGSLADAVLFNDSSDDDTWDAVWDAAVTIDDKGWVAEMRIPLSQLRFQVADRQTWGLHVVRVIQRCNEESWWAPIPKNESGFASRMGDLEGLDGIEPRRHLELLPYATTRGTFNGTAEAGNPFDDGSRLAAAAGLDVKWGLTSNLTVDATINPDFGQVEVDPAVVNLSAFETFFEEKRPFFIEGAQAFSTFGRNGASGYMGFNRTRPTHFYSRRIGRAPQGSASGDFTDVPAATTILSAAKLTGKTRSGWTMNLIDAVTSREWADVAAGTTRGDTEVEPLTNYLVTRVRRDLGQRAGFGLLATLVNRDLGTTALDARLASSAFVVGGDGHWFPTPKRDYVVTGSLSTSRVTGSPSAVTRLQRASTRYYQRPDASHLSLDPQATTLSGWNLQTDMNKNSGGVRPNVAFWAVSPGFEVNDAGFATSADRVGGHAALVFLKPTPDRFTRNRNLFVAKWNVWNFARDPVGDGYYASGSATFLNYWSARLSLHAGRSTIADRLTRGGPAMRSPGFWSLTAWLGGDDRKPVAWEFEAGYDWSPDGTWGGSGRLGLELKPMPSLTAEIGPSLTRRRDERQYVQTRSDPAATQTFGARYVFGALDQTEWSMDTRISYIMNPRMSLQMYLQPLISVGRYNDFTQAGRPRTQEFARFGRDIGTIAYDAAGDAYRIDPGDGGEPFTLSNPDFNFKALRVNAVYRWEVRPGSTLYVVWTQQREDQDAVGRFAFGRNTRQLWRTPADNVVMVKMSYWFAR